MRADVLKPPLWLPPRGMYAKVLTSAFWHIPDRRGPSSFLDSERNLGGQQFSHLTATMVLQRGVGISSARR
jgi:hypothetical protein